MKQDFYSQHANTNWRISRAVCAPLLTAVLLLGVDLAAPMAHGAIHYQRLKSFESVPDDGALPRAGLVPGSDGALYGTTEFGGNRGGGTVFKISSDGSGYRVLHDFTIYGGEGYQPQEVVEGSDGALYGTTRFGGNGGCINDIWPGCGTVFKLNKDGSEYSVLHHFSGIAGEGQVPFAGLVEGSDGAFYGTTVVGGTYDVGTVFKLNKDGSGYTVLRSLGDSGGDGQNPQAGLVEGSDGALYGTTADGGTNNGGTVFKLNKDGSGYSVLHKFSTSDGQGPQAPLVEGSDGALYGTTVFGGTTEGAGTVFKLNKDGSGYRVLHNFAPFIGEGHNPFAGLIEGRDGALYGTTRGGGGVFKLNRDGNGYTELHIFSESNGDGQAPEAGLVEGSDGALYGTTSYGGSNGAGTVFKLNKDGASYGVLHSFGSTGGDGKNPQGLVGGSDGALYGTTANGGTDRWAGTVFKLSQDGNGYSLLHSFSSGSGDGQLPQAGLMEGSDGTLYGTTLHGINLGGTIFKLNKDGSGYSVLHRFSNNDGAAGQFPYAGLVEGSDGALYGTTRSGGTSYNGAGTVFKVNKDGTSYSVLHSFNDRAGDGQSPEAGLMEGSDGALYGTTTNGGMYTNQYAAGFGTVFKLNKDGSDYSVLHHFGGTGGDGRAPRGLVEGSDGALYGTTVGGGSNDVGTVFKLNKDSSGYSVLRNFGSSVGDGASPQAGLVEGGDGALYGTTANGGSNNAGTVFKLNRDGSGYDVLRSFSSAGGDGQHPSGELVKGSDRTFYGTTRGGGDLHFGTVFKLFASTPIIVITRIELDGAGARLNLSGGAAGQPFQIQTTTNLTPSLWQTIGTNQFGIDGKFQFFDTSASNYPSRFYRSATP